MQSTNPTKSIVAIFAHPDDEAFGPAGTIFKYSKVNDIYLLCATRGEAGSNQKRIAHVREKELKESAKILGVKQVFFLGFIDGTLSNSIYHKLAEKIEKHLRILKPETIITYEPRGISGHIDHIVVSMVTTFVFYRLSFIKTLLYYCRSSANSKRLNNYFIYFPPGYRREEIDKVVDIEKEWPTKVKAMMAHKSQRHDAERILKSLEKLPKEECFLTKTK